MTFHLAASGLTWDATTKTYEAARGQTNVVLTFHTNNRSSEEIAITAVQPSCGCTIPRLPILPWRISAGAADKLEIEVDLRGRQGRLTKSIAVESSAGADILTIDVKMPELDLREKNRLMAFADRQAVFKLDCAKCHLEPAKGKMGQELFRTICRICHEAEHRAEMVPDLRALKKRMDGAYWTEWIRLGKPGTFMPAFSKPFGGPLEDAQIASLVSYLTERFRSSTTSEAPPQTYEP